MFERVPSLCHHIKATGLELWLLNAYIGLRDPSDLLLLPRSNGIESITVLTVGPTANFHEDQFVSIAGHNV